ncbi:hypothetical protein [Micrococcus luteus]|uniref:hypothetical protein n=1 Tax=Micrococcus luteus TaxID=1270 RepID=UPI0019D0780D|nr:hypothetical protein [Micrococcus luteus]MBN6750965.1 hypothetical protein [Micrococcus luteus]MBN6760975.1 hypothetical protein [Micrococcus luteus]MBN6800431.1 hypothetical protein [Micrococcus luteus]MDT1990845.1 hypothetical protein [Micrococcus luteus]
MMEFFPVAFPVITVEQLGAPAWLPSLAIAGLVVLSSTLTGVSVALTSSRSPAFAVRLGADLRSRHGRARHEDERGRE